MAKEMDLVKLNTLKRYIKDVKKMRVSSTAVNDLRARSNKILKDIIKFATASAKEDKRDTIMPRDMDPAMEKVLGAKNLETKEIFRELKKLGPIELGDLSKMINEFIKEEKARRE